jgi:UDP-3-O-[3-hydroxymyristoyl] glucosamine N-acyltransferase
MFTGHTVQLAEFDGQFGLEVIRDCALSYVGKVPTELERRVVPCNERRHLKDALGREGIVGIITCGENVGLIPEAYGLAISSDPQASAWQLHDSLTSRAGFQWEDFPTRVDSAADVRPGAHVAERNVVVGPNSVIMPGAVVCERTVIGANCLVGPGSVIGCEAFEVDTTLESWALLKQSGGVLLEDGVEITGLTTVVRATFGGFTSLGEQTKLDCHVHVAHDCKIGRRVRIAAAAELSGRVTVGDEVFIGPNCSISNGLTIGEKSTITIGAVVVRDVEPGSRVTGHFAVPHTNWLRFVKSIS